MRRRALEFVVQRLVETFVKQPLLQILLVVALKFLNIEVEKGSM